MIESVNQFLNHCRFERKLNEKTIYAYTIDLLQFNQFLKNNYFSLKIIEVNKEILKSYLQFITNLKPKTIKRKIATLKAMFNFIEYECDNFINPFRKMKIRLKEPMILPKVMSLSDVQLILKEAYMRKTTKEGVRDIAILEMLFATGIRVSELTNLKNEDVDINNRLVKVYGKGSKERIIQICHNETLSSLINYMKLYSKEIKDSGFFFINRLGKSISSQSVRLMVKKITAKVGLKNITPHCFRHTFATLLLEEDVDIKYIQRLLGHSSISVTQIYTHVNSEKQREILQNKHPRRKMQL